MPNPRKHTDRLTVTPYSSLGYAFLRPQALDKRWPPERQEQWRRDRAARQKGELPPDPNDRWYTRVLGENAYQGTGVLRSEGEAGKRRVKQILKERIMAGLAGKKNGHAKPITKKPTAPRFLCELTDEYRTTRLAKRTDTNPTGASASQRKNFALGEVFYLNAIADKRIDYETIRRAIATKEVEAASGRLATQTRRSYLQELRAMFAYAVEEGYLERNPIRKLPKKASVKRGGFSADEMRKILDYFAPDAATVQAEAWLVLKLQSLIGCRIGELVGGAYPVRFDPDGQLQPVTEERGLMRACVSHRGLWLMGKGGRVRHIPLVIPEALEVAAKSDERARLRLAWLTEIATLAHRLTALPANRDGRIFSLTTDAVRTTLRRARIALGMDTTDGRGTHAVRKYAIWYMRAVLVLDDRKKAILAGHSEDTAATYYHGALTPEEQAETLLL